MPLLTSFLSELRFILPESVVALGVLLLLLLGVSGLRRSIAYVTGGTVGCLLLATCLSLFLPETGTAFQAFVLQDSFTCSVEILILLSAALVILISSRYMQAEGLASFEYPVLILFATLGMMVMVSAGNLLTLYLGLELQSLALYVLAALHRDSVRSTEAGLKYFVLSSLSSGFLLYGISLVYGVTGQIGFQALADVIVEGATPLLLIFGLVLIFAGVVFKISAVPFHMWTPDVYEGAPTPVTTFFAAAPKLAAMAVLLRVATLPFGGLATQWHPIIVFISLASMLLAAFAGIGQHNIKRLMAYSSIGHMGYALIGLAAGGSEGLYAVFFYMVLYLVMTLGVFACILAMRVKGGMVERIDDLAGLARTHPMLAFFLSALIFSMAGIPPLAGFWGKWFVFFAAVQENLVPLALVGAVSSVIAAFYYLRLVKLIYFDKPNLVFDPLPLELRCVVAASAVFVISFVLFASTIEEFSRQAVASLLL